MSSQQTYEYYAEVLCDGHLSVPENLNNKLKPEYKKENRDVFPISYSYSFLRCPVENFGRINDTTINKGGIQ